jgi:large subunit ribosomal protein L4
MKTDIYNAEGKKAGTIDLPEHVFNVAWNDALMHQVVTGMQANARTPVAHVKDRGSVRGGGKKPWRQKGTGRARHGSIRSPIWKGGGVTHGPSNEKSYAKQIPKKMRAKALFMALSRKLKDGEILFVDSFALETPKTAQAMRMLSSFGAIKGFERLAGKTARRNSALIAFAQPRDAAIKSFRNIGTVSSSPVRDLNPVAVLKHRYLVIENPEAAVAIVAKRMASKVATTTEEPLTKKTVARKKTVSKSTKAAPKDE